LKSFMDVPVRSWVDDFTPTERKWYKNLKSLLLSGRVVPGLVPIVKEFEINWHAHWRRSVWEDRRRSMQVENVVEAMVCLKHLTLTPPTYLHIARNTSW